MAWLLWFNVHFTHSFPNVLGWVGLAGFKSSIFVCFAFHFFSAVAKLALVETQHVALFEMCKNKTEVSFASANKLECSYWHNACQSFFGFNCKKPWNWQSLEQDQNENQCGMQVAHWKWCKTDKNNASSLLTFGCNLVPFSQFVESTKVNILQWWCMCFGFCKRGCLLINLLSIQQPNQNLNWPWKFNFRCPKSRQKEDKFRMKSKQNGATRKQQCAHNFNMAPSETKVMTQRTIWSMD